MREELTQDDLQRMREAIERGDLICPGDMFTLLDEIKRLQALTLDTQRLQALSLNWINWQALYEDGVEQVAITADKYRDPIIFLKVKARR